MDMEQVYTSNFKVGAYPFYEHLRKTNPIFAMNEQNAQASWMVTKYDHVKELLKSPSFIKDQSKLFSNQNEENDSGEPNLFGNMMLDVDPPDHTRLRKLVQPSFNPKTIKHLAPRIEQIAEELLDDIQDKSEPVDLIEDYAFPLPIIVISELLGVPTEDRNKFRKWSNTILAAQDEMNQDFIQDVEAFTQYLTELFEKGSAHPEEDLVSQLIESQEDGDKLSRNELYSMVVLLIIAGHETTVNLIGNTMHALFEHPAQLEQVKEDHQLISGAIEEGLRYYSPVDFSTARWAGEDMEFHGQSIRKGDFVMASISSANRDEEKFEQADSFNITRERNAHVAFGFGIHFCLGAPLARLEGKIALEKLLERFPNINLDASRPSPQWRRVFLLRGLDSLPVQL
ncbi:cytochrome P450 [Halobacillus litoralis]|uniref:cytochrome P450 family protein n=1 Tax=Halobacillus litoralis TaxID=45668 RepID=UPI001CD2912F|nr:cytochrome P450 [Halobacillus litoralis]MCA0970563.1 cytochrome P450 [Halobacillus litoralis]